MLIFLLILCFCLLGIFIYHKVYQWNYNRYKQFVLTHSIALKELHLLNSNFKFNNVETIYKQYTYDNEFFFSNISCQDFLIYQLQYEQREIKLQMMAIDKNKIDYEKYKEQLLQITQIGTYSTSYDKFKYETLIEIEKELFQKNCMQPITEFVLSISLYCSTINGHIYEEKSQSFNKAEVNALIKRVNAKNGSFFNDREIWNSICRVERGKVTNKMRFSIYQRDRYRCCKCGMTNRYTTLEIDHIIPIAKGGKSTYNNLQTLCHNCNAKKGASIANYLTHD